VLEHTLIKIWRKYSWTHWSFE